MLWLRTGWVLAGGSGGISFRTSLISLEARCRRVSSGMRAGRAFVSQSVDGVGGGCRKVSNRAGARLGVLRRCRAEGAWEGNPFCPRNEKGLGSLAPELFGGRHTNPLCLGEYHGSISDVKRKRWDFLNGHLKNFLRSSSCGRSGSLRCVGWSTTWNCTHLGNLWRSESTSC
jgi:hypothetical protein